MCSIHITYSKGPAIGGERVAGNWQTVAGVAGKREKASKRVRKRESLSFSKRSYGLHVCVCVCVERCVHDKWNACVRYV